MTGHAERHHRPKDGVRQRGVDAPAHVESRGHLRSGCAESLRQAVLGEQFDECVRQRGGVVLRHHQRRLVGRDELGDAAVAGRDDRTTACLRLEVDQQQALGVPARRGAAGGHDDPRAADQVAHLFPSPVRLGWHVPYRRFVPGKEHVGERTGPEDVEPGPGHFADDLRPCLQQDVDSLLLDEATDEGHDGATR